MDQAATMFENIRIAIPIIIAVILWIYLLFIKNDIRLTEELLRDKLWIDDPSASPETDMETNLKASIAAKEQQARTAIKVALMFSGVAIFFAVWI
ncbi:hypothetical protein FHW04_003878 [Pantoea sp. AN62]|uniref:hypothetical protein n=1 Tax=Pantoea TaxID=53335 RepID=UPI000A2567BD|nr:MULTISPECIES: hypothetical protein [Pantoea]MDU4747839.1 hypothetical protein [Pantoea sp.]HCR0227249.1 hypothetical protein [Enterobacter kobei]ORM52288.1 hypothetical protein HA39_20825 [Pantoea brenneri]OXM21201.1 hypothetical protein CBI35_16965 [Pantoea sp. AV62]HCR0505868.1 hypothetical protein [Enterobacter kobei]